MVWRNRGIRGIVVATVERERERKSERERERRLLTELNGHVASGRAREHSKRSVPRIACSALRDSSGSGCDGGDGGAEDNDDDVDVGLSTKSRARTTRGAETGVSSRAEPSRAETPSVQSAPRRATIPSERDSRRMALPRGLLARPVLSLSLSLFVYLSPVSLSLPLSPSLDSRRRRLFFFPSFSTVPGPTSRRDLQRARIRSRRPHTRRTTHPRTTSTGVNLRYICVFTWNLLSDRKSRKWLPSMATPRSVEYAANGRGGGGTSGDGGNFGSSQGRAERWRRRRLNETGSTSINLLDIDFAIHRY